MAQLAQARPTPFRSTQQPELPDYSATLAEGTHQGQAVARRLCEDRESKVAHQRGCYAAGDAGEAVGHLQAQKDTETAAGHVGYRFDRTRHA